MMKKKEEKKNSEFVHIDLDACRVVIVIVIVVADDDDNDVDALANDIEDMRKEMVIEDKVRKINEDMIRNNTYSTKTRRQDKRKDSRVVSFKE